MNKQLNAYESVNSDYIKSAEELHSKILELASVLDESLYNECLTTEECRDILNDYLFELKSVYSNFMSKQSVCLGLICKNIIKAELEDNDEKLIIFNEERDQMMKEQDTLTQGYENVKNFIEKTLLNYKNKAEQELINE